MDSVERTKIQNRAEPQGRTLVGTNLSGASLRETLLSDASLSVQLAL